MHPDPGCRDYWRLRSSLYVVKRRGRHRDKSPYRNDDAEALESGVRNNSEYRQSCKVIRVEGNNDKGLRILQGLSSHSQYTLFTR